MTFDSDKKVYLHFERLVFNPTECLVTLLTRKAWKGNWLSFWWSNDTAGSIGLHDTNNSKMFMKPVNEKTKFRKDQSTIIILGEKMPYIWKLSHNNNNTYLHWSTPEFCIKIHDYCLSLWSINKRSGNNSTDLTNYLILRNSFMWNSRVS